MVTNVLPVKTAPRLAVASDSLQVDTGQVNANEFGEAAITTSTSAEGQRNGKDPYLRSELAPAVSSGRSCRWIRSYNGASKSAISTIEIVMTTVLPA